MTENESQEIATHRHTINSIKDMNEYKNNKNTEKNRHLATNFFETLVGICKQKNISNMLDIALDKPSAKKYYIYYTPEKRSETPHLLISWFDNDLVKIHMVESISLFRKRIKLENPLTYETIINLVIKTLVEQNEEYTKTKQMIEDCVNKFKLDLKPHYIKRTKRLWHVSYKENEFPNSIVIQYDEKSKEFLFQKRYKEKYKMSKIELNAPCPESWNQLKKINTDDWVAQPKLDGIRTTLCNIDNNFVLAEKHGSVKSNQYPEIIMGAIQGKLPEGTILDGELCILENNYNANLYSLLSRQVGSLEKATKRAQTNPATFVAFDIIKYKNESVKDLSWKSRSDILQSLDIYNDKIKPITNHTPMDLVSKIEPLNMEGMVIKRKDGSYNSKWLKLKYYQEYDLKIIGTTSNTRAISSIELEHFDNGDYAGKVSSNNLVTQTKEFAKEIIGKTATIRCRMNPSRKVREPVLIRIK
jgi:ATP-dependent DNA ligase